MLPKDTILHNIIDIVKIRIKPTLKTHKPVIHGGLSAKQSDSNILDFSSNIVPITIPKVLKNTIKKQINVINSYPDIHCSRLLTELALYTKIPKANLIVGNGAIEIIYNFCNAFISKDTPVLIPIPTFAEYETASTLNNAKVSFFNTMDLSKHLQEFISLIPRNGCIFICNPNNPTGNLISKNDLLKILSSAQKFNSLVFVDECFIELVPESNESIISSIKHFDNLIVLRSLTKSFGLAGLRIGYAASSKPIISVLKKIKIPWSINSIAEQTAITALHNSSYFLKSISIIEKEYKFLTSKINTITGFQCLDSKTNFILIKTKKNSSQIQRNLLDKKILVRDCKNFRGLNNHFIRIAIKSHKDNVKLINALETIT